MRLNLLSIKIFDKVVKKLLKSLPLKIIIALCDVLKEGGMDLSAPQ